MQVLQVDAEKLGKSLMENRTFIQFQNIISHITTEKIFIVKKHG